LFSTKRNQTPLKKLPISVSISKQDTGGFIMIKSFVPALVLASALAAPTFAFAQNNGALTREQVRSELVQLEKAGYNPSQDRVTYPQNLQAAQARVNAEQGVAATSYGPSAAGTAQSGSRSGATISMSDRNSVYFGH
jgi:hypothetical protein